MSGVVVQPQRVRRALDLFPCPGLRRTVRARACLGFQVRVADGRADAPAPCAGCAVGREIAAQLGVAFARPEAPS